MANAKFYKRERPVVRDYVPDAPAEILGMHITELGLNPLTLKVLEGRISTLYEIACSTRRELFRIQGFSKKTLFDIQKVLDKYNLTLAPDPLDEAQRKDAETATAESDTSTPTATGEAAVGTVQTRQKQKADKSYVPNISDELAATPVSTDLGLSEGVVKTLTKARVRSVRDIALLTDRDLYFLRALGRKGSQEIRDYLASIGLTTAPMITVTETVTVNARPETATARSDKTTDRRAEKPASDKTADRRAEKPAADKAADRRADKPTGENQGADKRNRRDDTTRSAQRERQSDRERAPRAEAVTIPTDMSTLLEEMPFTRKTYNILKRARMNTLGDIMAAFNAEQTARFGRDVQKELTAYLRGQGVSIKQSSQQNDRQQSDRQQGDRQQRESKTGGKQRKGESTQGATSPFGMRDSGDMSSVLAPKAKRTQTAMPRVDSPYKRFSQDGKVGLKTASGRVVIPAVYDEIGYFSEGLAVVEQDEYLGYIDEQNNMIISPRYEMAMKYSEGLACVARAGKCGYIDREGNIVIDFRFEAGTPFEDGTARVKQDGRWAILDREGNVKFI